MRRATFSDSDFFNLKSQREVVLVWPTGSSQGPVSVLVPAISIFDYSKSLFLVRGLR